MGAGVRDYYQSYWSQGGFKPTRPLPEPIQGLLEPLIDRDTACLDVGCGDGRTAGPWVSERARSYTGVEVSPAAVENAVGMGLDVRLIENSGDLPFDDASFDVAMCLEVLEHLFDPLATATEIRRVLKPGGAAVISVPNAAYWERRFEMLRGIWNPYGTPKGVDQPWADPHIRFFTLSTLRRFLGEAGFDDVFVGGHHGGLVSNRPPMRNMPWLWKLQRPYMRVEPRRPGLLSQRLHAVARVGAGRSQG